jgi:hypothetical protein
MVLQKEIYIWESLQIYTEENVCDGPNVHVFCAPGKETVYGPSFFMETTITGIVYLDMLQQFLIPQLD